MDAAQSEKLLSKCAPFSYLLRQGEEEFFYYLSFVDEDNQVAHRMIKIEIAMKGWFFRNGGTHIRQDITDLIPIIMHCSSNQCQSLRPTK
jgi:hypothetical protein